MGMTTTESQVNPYSNLETYDFDPYANQTEGVNYGIDKNKFYVQNKYSPTGEKRYLGTGILTSSKLGRNVARFNPATGAVQIILKPWGEGEEKDVTANYNQEDVNQFANVFRNNFKHPAYTQEENEALRQYLLNYGKNISQNKFGGRINYFDMFGK